ncbi:MAG: alcohol dehydrogenase [Acidobacteria bacterium]|nr:MAG: alcohol dehydrogenase [Acidobacteriota bacterium]
MRALRFDGELRFVTDAPCPRREGESLVRVLLAGICRTDIEITRGYAGFRGIPGHEFVGVVETSSNPQLIGRRVVGEINVGCGHCAWCQRSDPRHCPSRTTLGIRGRDGAFAEFLSLPAENLFPIPETLADEVAVFTEPLAAAAEILEQTTIEPEDQVVILGDGKLGLLIAQVVRLTGCRLTLIGKHEHKLAIARRRGLHTLTVNEASNLPPRGMDCVIEATGSPAGLEWALRLVRPRGRIVLKSTYHGQLMVDLTPLVVNEITVLGSRCGRFPRALELLTTGQVEVADLVSGIWPLEAGARAFSEAQRPGVLKVLLRP